VEKKSIEMEWVAASESFIAHSNICKKLKIFDHKYQRE